MDFKWNIIKELPEKYFKLNSGTSIVVLCTGLYEILVHYTCTCSTHGQGNANVDILLDGSVVARNYHGSNTGYHISYTFSHIEKIQANQTINIRYLSNSGSVADEAGNYITIVKKS